MYLREWVEFFSKTEHDLKQEKNVRIERGLKAKQYLTLDYIYNWWQWVIRFAPKTRYTNWPKPYVEVGKSYETLEIGEFRQFCDYLVKYKNVKII